MVFNWFMCNSLHKEDKINNYNNNKLNITVYCVNTDRTSLFRVTDTTSKQIASLSSIFSFYVLIYVSVSLHHFCSLRVYPC